MIENIKWLGHASFKIKKDKVIYIDPWKIKETEPADIILISHSHFDHFSVDDIKKIQTNKTTVVVPKDCAKQLSGKVKVIKPGDSITIDGIDIEGVPAYNPSKQFHPKANQWLGFVITIGTTRIYYAGDTDVTEEMKNLKDIDIAILPIGGTYTSTAIEAASAANIFNPKIVIPAHFGDIVGSQSDADVFKKQFKGNTVVLKKEI